jgi:hypothetical protein
MTLDKEISNDGKNQEEHSKIKNVWYNIGILRRKGYDSVG